MMTTNEKQKVVADMNIFTAQDEHLIDLNPTVKQTFNFENAFDITRKLRSTPTSQEVVFTLALSVKVLACIQSCVV